jgi:hypothetical protein
MRHRIFLIGILLALSLSGWGGVVAAAFCAHDAARSSLMAEDHACCHAKLEPQTPHCNAASESPSHEAMTMSEMEAMPPVVEQAAGVAAEVWLGQAADVCSHCVSRSGLPTPFAIVREPEQKRRDAQIAAPQLLKQALPLVVSFAPNLTARQNAPPGAAARRHLLLNVFVI